MIKNERMGKRILPWSTNINVRNQRSLSRKTGKKERRELATVQFASDAL
jgi:hypothetical protein